MQVSSCSCCNSVSSTTALAVGIYVAHLHRKKVVAVRLKLGILLAFVVSFCSHPVLASSHRETDPSFTSKGGVKHEHPPISWKRSVCAPRSAKPLVTVDDFIAWFLSDHGGLKDLRANGLPEEVGIFAEEIVSGDQSQQYPFSPVRPGEFRASWGTTHDVGSGDRYDSITVETSGRTLTNIYADVNSFQIFRILVARERDLFVIDTLPTGEQLVRRVRSGSYAYREVRLPQMIPPPPPLPYRRYALNR